MLTGFHVLPGPASSSQERFTETLEIKSSTARVFFLGGGKENTEQYIMRDFFVLKIFVWVYKEIWGDMPHEYSCYFWEV